MKTVIIHCLFITLLMNGFLPIQIASAQTYKYKYTLKEVNSKAMDDPKSMYFTDDKIGIGFIFEEKNLNFTIKNFTNDVMKIIWDETSIVQKGNAKKILHSGVKYIDAHNSQPPTVMPPKSAVTDFVLPSDNVSYSSFIPDWVISDLFDWNGGDAGTTFSLYLPIQYQDKTLSYYYTFEIQ